MANIKNRIVHFLVIISAIILVNFIHYQTVESADNAQLIVDENLKPGMTLKEAIDLLGPPEKMEVSDTGTIVLPYNRLGLSIEVISGGATIDTIHLQPSFKGRFASGLEMGADYQKILSLYNQPDIMTKEIVEYHDMARTFKIDNGKLTGADLYSGKSKLYSIVPGSMTGKTEGASEKVRAEINDEVREELREEIIREVREEVRREVRDEAVEEVRKETIKEGREALLEEGRVFDLFGFKVKRSFDGVIITEIRSGSVISDSGLKVGDPVRRAFLEGYGSRNIYSVGGLENILEKAVLRGNKTINFLKEGNRYYKVEVPEIK